MFAFRPYRQLTYFIDSINDNSIICEITKDNNYQVSFYFEYFENKCITIESESFSKPLQNICNEIIQTTEKNLKNHHINNEFRHLLLKISKFCLLFSNLNYNVHYELIGKFKLEIFNLLISTLDSDTLD